MIREVKKRVEKEKIAESILSDLGDWFGIKEYVEDYVKKSSDMPFIAYYDSEKAVGFISLNDTSADTVEIFVMGVLRDYQGRGIGRELYGAFESMAKSKGFKYVQVKTVKSGTYENYDLTNEFYKGMGFVELECFPEMWDKWNPCQIYIKYIG